MNDSLEKARAWLAMAGNLRGGARIDGSLAALLDEAMAEGRDQALREAVTVAHEMAADYECDWSSPEFNYASDVERALRALGSGAPSGATEETK